MQYKASVVAAVSDEAAKSSIKVLHANKQLGHLGTFLELEWPTASHYREPATTKESFNHKSLPDFIIGLLLSLKIWLCCWALLLGFAVGLCCWALLLGFAVRFCHFVIGVLLLGFVVGVLLLGFVVRFYYLTSTELWYQTVIKLWN